MSTKAIKSKKRPKKLEKKLKSNEETEVKERKEVKVGQTLFVGNVPSNTKRVQLLKLFRPFGNVLSIRFRTENGKIIFKHKMRIESPTINAYVYFESVEAATKGLAVNGQLLKGNILRVQRSEKIEVNSSSKNTVFIGNLKSDTTENSLHQIFSSCGEIEYVRTLKNPQQLGCNGTAYVCFKKPEAVGLALELEGTMLLERPIHVERYSTKKLEERKIRKAEGNLPKKGKSKLEHNKITPKVNNKKTPKVNNKNTPKGNNKNTPKVNNKNSEDSKAQARKTEFRGVKSDGIKKKPKKKVPNELKKLAKKIAPRN